MLTLYVYLIGGTVLPVLKILVPAVQLSLDSFGDNKPQKADLQRFWSDFGVIGAP
jgi:hypothetical protein